MKKKKNISFYIFLGGIIMRTKRKEKYNKNKQNKKNINNN